MIELTSLNNSRTYGSMIEKGIHFLSLIFNHDVPLRTKQGVRTYARIRKVRVAGRSMLLLEMSFIS